MKLQATILTIVLLSLSGCSPQVVTTEQNEEIQKALRDEIKATTLRVFEKFETGDSDELEQFFSEEVLQQNPNLSQLILNIQPLLQKYEFRLFDEYYTRLSSSGSRTIPSIIPSSETSFIVQGVVIPTDSSYMQFWRSDNKGFQYLIFLQYIQNGGQWKLLGFHAGDYAIDGKTAPDLVRTSELLSSQEKHLSAEIYALAAQKIMRPLRFLQYQNENDCMNTLRQVNSQFRMKYDFPIQLENEPNIILYGFDLKVTTSGISPVLKYKTSTNLANHEKVAEEAKTLFPEFTSLFPDLRDPFQYVILQAYNELPEDPQKTYAFYNTVLKDGNRI